MDNFALIGGSGATLCLLLALLLCSRSSENRRLAWCSLPFGIFNMNEPLVFGLPVILNPILFLPFLAVPVVSMLIAYLATACGFMPVVTSSVTWTTPVPLSGLAISGSINGALVQMCIRDRFLVDDHSRWEERAPKQAMERQNRWKDNRERMQTEMETGSKDTSEDNKSLLDELEVENRERYDYRQFLRRFAVLKEEIQVDMDSFDYAFYTYGLSLYGNMPLIEPQESREVYRVEDFAVVIDTSMSLSLIHISRCSPSPARSAG